MQFEKIQLNAPHLTLWLSEDKGLVFHQGQKELSQIEPISIALLIALDEGLTNQQALIELQQHSNLSKEQLKPSLQQVRELFKNTQQQRTYADGLYPELQNHISQQPPQNSFCIKVANATFAITSDDESLLTEIKALLKQIQITAPNEVHFVIDIEIYKGNYLLVSNDIVVEEGLTQQQVMPAFIDRLQILAYQHSDYCFGFHGAALTQTPNTLSPLSEAPNTSSPLSEPPNTLTPLSEALDPCTTILLPGVSGAGKSTLTAELSRKNFSVYSDEIIALDNNFNLTTLALPMAIKSGSWQHIAKLYPELNTQPEWHRVDGRILKYIWPEKIAVPKDPGLRREDEKECYSVLDTKTTCAGSTEEVSPVPLIPNTLPLAPNNLSPNTSSQTLLISPSYNKNATPKATKLSVIDTIALVTNGGYQLGVELTEHRVEQLIRYCEYISAYHISYANSEQAQQLVKQLCKQ